MTEVEHVDERLHAHVRGCDDHRERRLRLADFLQQGDPVGVGQSEIEHQHFWVERVHLAPSLGPTRGEGQVVAFGEETLVGPPERRLVLDEQHFAPRAEGGGPHGGPIYAGPPRRLRAAQLGLLSSSNRSSSLVSTNRKRSSSLAPRRHTVNRRSAAFRWINIRAPRPALSIWRVPARSMTRRPAPSPSCSSSSVAARRNAVRESSPSSSGAAKTFSLGRVDIVTCSSTVGSSSSPTGGYATPMPYQLTCGPSIACQRTVRRLT